MRFNLTIAGKLVIAYGLFLIPICYLGLQLILDKEAGIAFARKEVLGVHYIAEVRDVQDALARDGNMARQIDRIKANEQASGATLNTAEAAAALLLALEGTDRGAAIQAAADLIGKAADGSNLTLDPDLDSYYTQDVLTVKVPAAVAGVTSLAAAVTGTAGRNISVREQIDIGVLTGSLQPTLDGLASDFDSAVKGNPDRTVAGTVGAALARASATAKSTLATLNDHATASTAAVAARQLLDALTAVGANDAAEVEHLLNARIAGFRSTELVSVGIAFSLFMAAVVYVLLVVQRGAVRPLRLLTESMRRLAAGDLTTHVQGLTSTDEVGSMARAVQVFKDAMVQADLLAAAKLRDQAIRDRRQAAMDTHTQDFGASVSGVMASLTQSAADMNAAANTMATAAARTRDSTSSAVSGANASAHDLNAVAVAAEQMAASINEISRQVSHVTSAVSTAVQQASQTDTKVASLATAADRIGDVVRLISDIAGQTNLLALNATIEAARAGEAGKGFAVVAGEVKTLATQTARATDQISNQIVAIRAATEEAVGAVREVGLAIGQVESVATAIAAAVEQQAVATQEISSSVQNVTAATTSAADVMREVVAISEETDTASRSVLTTAEAISRTAGTLRAEVNEFLEAMRHDDADNRRAYERILGGGMSATLAVPGRPDVRTVIQDISRGGTALLCDVEAACGTEVSVDLPSCGRVSGRVVRTSTGLLSVAFRQDVDTSGRVDLAMATIARRGVQGAA